MKWRLARAFVLGGLAGWVAWLELRFRLIGEAWIGRDWSVGPPRRIGRLK